MHPLQDSEPRPTDPARPGNASSTTVMECRDLAISYRARPALSATSLEIPANRITAIVGPSGCGKSSFLMSLNRLTDLIEGCRTDGEVRLRGDSIFTSATDLTELRRRVGMIFQSPNPFPFSIERNIHLPLKEKGVRDRQQRDEITQRVLTETGLWDEVRDRLADPAHQLSGGQQQRLCIARALALEPEVLLMDEPCSALDPLASDVVENLIERISAHTTIVIVTHNLSQARRIADRVAMFWYRDNAGYLLEQGDKYELFNTPASPVTMKYLAGSVG